MVSILMRVNSNHQFIVSIYPTPAFVFTNQFFSEVCSSSSVCFFSSVFFVCDFVNIFMRNYRIFQCRLTCLLLVSPGNTAQGALCSFSLCPWAPAIRSISSSFTWRNYQIPGGSVGIISVVTSCSVMLSGTITCCQILLVGE